MNFLSTKIVLTKFNNMFLDLPICVKLVRCIPLGCHRRKLVGINRIRSKGNLRKHKYIQPVGIPFLNSSIIQNTCLSAQIYPVGYELRHYCCEKKCASMKKNPARHCYHDDCEKAINEQILAELNAAYAYLSMSCYFGRSDVALPGCHGYFTKMHMEEIEHAHKLISYQNMRGGRVQLFPITCTDCTEWNITKAFEVALEMEKIVKEKLTKAHDIAENHHDLQMMDMIVTDCLQDQDRSISEIGRLLSRFNSMEGCTTCGCVQFLFDKEVHKAFITKSENKMEIPLPMLYK